MSARRAAWQPCPQQGAHLPRAGTARRRARQRGDGHETGRKSQQTSQSANRRELREHAHMTWVVLGMNADQRERERWKNKKKKKRQEEEYGRKKTKTEIDPSRGERAHTISARPFHLLTSLLLHRLYGQGATASQCASILPNVRRNPEKERHSTHSVAVYCFSARSFQPLLLLLLPSLSPALLALLPFQ